MSNRRTNNFIEIMSSDDEGDDDLLLGRGSVFARPFRVPSGGGVPSTAPKPSSTTSQFGVAAATRTPPPSALPSSSSLLVSAAGSRGGGSGNVAGATAAAATIASSTASAAAAAVTKPSVVHTTPIGFVDFDYVSNAVTGSPGDAVIINRARDSPIPNVVEVLLEGTRKMCGVIDHDEARLLAPILDRCFPDKLKCHGIIVSNHSHPKVVRVHFAAQSSTRRISKFELQPIERQIKYYLKGRKALVPETTSLKPPPVTPGSALAAAKGAPPSAGATLAGAASDENRLNAAAVVDTPAAGAHLSRIHVGDWTCFVSLTATLATADGATVELVREPANRHDRNAIRVDHNGTSIGYVRSTEAGKLAVVLDAFRSYLQWTGKITGNDNAPMKALNVSFHCREPSLALAVQGNLKRRLAGFIASDARGTRGPRSAHDFLSSESGVMSQLAASSLELSEKDWMEQKDALDEMFDEQSRSQLANLPQYPMPDLFVRNKVKLFRHQVAGIRWLVHQEKQDLPSYFECDQRHGRTGWTCKITKTRFANKPQGMKGGILADDMGLGKTLQTLGLILANPPAGIFYPRKGLCLRGRDKDVPVTTLIVSPLTVIGNWYQQIFNHVNGRVDNKNITIAKYHGPARENMLVRVQQGQLDVLMTSYHTLASDYKTWVEAMEEDAEEDLTARSKKKRRKAPHIFELEFHRIVLDEAHIVRNSQASLWKAVMALQAERKVCLTGTPFVNNPSDIHSLLNFLNVQPLCLPHVFRRMVSDPIKDRREIGLQTVRATMAHVALRRKKEGLMDEIHLVSKTLQTFRIGFIEKSEHFQIYEFLYETARSYFLGLLNSDDKKKASRSLMKMLALVLRIRQCCSHLGIINKDFLEQARAHLKSAGEAGGAAAAQIGAEEGSRLLAFLCDAFKTSTVVECAVCLDEMEEENAVILRSCQHIFCERCLNQIENSICPMCRADYSPADMVTKQVAKGASEKFSAKDCMKNHGRSPKIQALLNLIDDMAPDEKGVIFSQWTSVLRIIENEFLRCGHTYDVISGEKTADERVDSMMRFDTERCDTVETPRFMLCSLMACGTGINLTRGNVVFMMDTWWNQAAENQAMDRVHRIGQTRPVRVYRLVMKDSIEERMIHLQQNKLMLAKGSMEKFANDEEKQQARLTALKDLFQVHDEDGVWH